MSSAARYYPRAPRYVFRTEDQTFVRFAGVEKGAAASPARIRDLSATGLCFTVDGDQAPTVGELLRVEFMSPEGRQMAWFATVMRIEERGEWDPEFGERSYTLVALRFQSLPTHFRQAIQRSISGKADDADPVAPRLAPGDAVRLGFCALSLAAAMLAICLPPGFWLDLFRH